MSDVERYLRRIHWMVIFLVAAAVTHSTILQLRVKDLSEQVYKFQEIAGDWNDKHTETLGLLAEAATLNLKLLKLLGETCRKTSYQSMAGLQN